MKKWVTHLLYNMVALQHTTRYFLKEEVNGKQQLSHRSYLELCNVTIATHTWMQRSKVQLICSWVTFSHNRVNQHYGSWIQTNTTALEGMALIFLMRMQDTSRGVAPTVDLIGITSIMEVLVRLVGVDDHVYPNFLDVMQWLADSNLLEMIVDKLNPSFMVMQQKHYVQ